MLSSKGLLQHGLAKPSRFTSDALKFQHPSKAKIFGCQAVVVIVLLVVLVAMAAAAAAAAVVLFVAVGAAATAAFSSPTWHASDSSAGTFFASSAQVTAHLVGQVGGFTLYMRREP